MDSIGKRIRFARKKKNLTLTDIKNLTGLSTGNLSELENDKFMPSANALIALSKILNVSIDWLLTGEKSDNEILSKDDYIQKESENADSLLQEKPCSVYALNEEEEKLLAGYRLLSEEKRRDIQGFIHVALQNKQNNDRKKTLHFFGSDD